MTNPIAALVTMRRSEQFKRATCSVVSMIECAMIGLALWSAHSSVFTAVGLAFAAGMTLVILFMLIVEKSEDTRVADQPAVAVAPSATVSEAAVSATAVSTASVKPAVEEETPKITGNGSLPIENANGSLPLEHEPPVVAAR